MAIAARFHHHPPLSLSRTPRRPPHPFNTHLLRVPSAPLPRSPAARRARVTATKPPPHLAARGEDDRALFDPEPRGHDSAPLLAAAATITAAAAALGSPLAALAASGGSMGGSSDDSSYSSSSYDSSYSTRSRRVGPTTRRMKSSRTYYSSSDESCTSSWWPSSSSPNTAEEGAVSTHVSVGTAATELSPAAKRRQDMVFWGGIALASAGAAALVFAALHHTPLRTTVVKLQVALRGVAAAKSFQKDLNVIAEKVETSNQRWYKFILTETIRSLHRHKDCFISSSLSADVKDPWKQHFNKISIEERSKFDEETLSNLDGIKRKKSYSKRTDGFKNEYIVLTILIAAEGALKFPEVRNSADLEAVVGKLNSIPAGEIRGIHVLWTPQEENDVLTEEELREDYPYLRPLRDHCVL